MTTEGNAGEAGNERDRVGYDALYKRALGTARGLAQFLQAFDPATADLLRLDTIEPRGTELFDVLPEWYRRIADIVARVEARAVERELLTLHVEVQRSRKRSLGRRMLDYYTLLRRSEDLTVLPYAVLLYRDEPALGYKTYEETFRGRTIATLTYFQVSLPALDARTYAAGDNALGRALASAMRLPRAESAPGGVSRCHRGDPWRARWRRDGRGRGARPVVACAYLSALPD